MRRRFCSVFSEVFVELFFVGLKLRSAVVALGREDRLRGQYARFDRSANAFAALRECQAGRIANQYHPVIDYPPVSKSIGQTVGMAAEVGRDIFRYPSLLDEIAAELANRKEALGRF